jgi:hypothetical protein
MILVKTQMELYHHKNQDGTGQTKG